MLSPLIAGHLTASILTAMQIRDSSEGKKSESMSGTLIDSEVAVKSIERFLSLLATIPDPRRAEGKLCQLPQILLFSILAVASGANPYRGIGTFIEVYRSKLNKACKINWKRPPAPTAIRHILQGIL